jgi:hypothetical protein
MMHNLRRLLHRHLGSRRRRLHVGELLRMTHDRSRRKRRTRYRNLYLERHTRSKTLRNGYLELLLSVRIGNEKLIARIGSSRNDNLDHINRLAYENWTRLHSSDKTCL